MARAARRHDDVLSPAAMQDYFAEVYWRKGAALDRENILTAFAMSAGEPSFEYRRVAEDFRMIESRLLPVIVAREAEAREALVALRAGASAGSVARRLQPFLVQVPSNARDLLLTNDHVRFVDGKTGEFAELVTEALYRDDEGLDWENAGYIAVEDSII